MEKSLPDRDSTPGPPLPGRPIYHLINCESIPDRLRLRSDGRADPRKA